MAKRPGNTLRDFAAGYDREQKKRASGWDSSPQLDLAPDSAPAAAKPKRPARLKLTIPVPLERETHRNILKYLNSFMVRGGAFHIPNEGLVSMLPEAKRHLYINALEADGMLLGNTDLFPVWAMPPEWRDALVAAGFEIPAHVALCAGVEVKREGWKPDAEWRAGRQPKAHMWLRAKGVPVKICRGVDEAVRFLEACGARFRVHLLSGIPRSGTTDTVQAGRKGPTRLHAPVTAGRAPGKSPVTSANLTSRNAAVTAHKKTAPRLSPGAPSETRNHAPTRTTKKAQQHGTTTA
jgi:hypothetical protein